MSQIHVFQILYYSESFTALDGLGYNAKFDSCMTNTVSECNEHKMRPLGTLNGAQNLIYYFVSVLYAIDPKNIMKIHPQF